MLRSIQWPPGLVVWVVGIPPAVAARIIYQDNVAQACGINFRHAFEFSICVRVLTHVDSLASESHHCQEHDTKPDLIQRPGVLVVAVAGAPATVPAEMMWKLSGTWRPSRPCKQRRKQAKTEEPSPNCISQQSRKHHQLTLRTNWHCVRTSRAVNCNVSGKNAANIPKQLPGDKLPTSLCWRNDIRSDQNIKTFWCKGAPMDEKADFNVASRASGVSSLEEVSSKNFGAQPCQKWTERKELAIKQQWWPSPWWPRLPWDAQILARVNQGHYSCLLSDIPCFKLISMSIKMSLADCSTTAQLSDFRHHATRKAATIPLESSSERCMASALTLQLLARYTRWHWKPQ